MFNLETVWPEWHIIKKIGQGSFGAVYMVRRETLGNVFYSALKVLEIPEDSAEIRNLQNMGMDEASIRTYFTQKARSVVDEISALESLKSAANVVSIEDYALHAHEDNMGWTILIRMEILESLQDYAHRIGTLSPSETVQIGIDICRALECCEQAHIIHRDIKPGNIFRTEFGTFKLGDFGISRQMEESAGSIYSQKGTSAYMAPEVARGEKYGRSVDLYSLGIVLYRFLNRGRLPFLPPYPAQILPADMEQASVRRLSGEMLPPPEMADPVLSGIILKACDPVSEKRYGSAAEMRKALEKWAFRNEQGQASEAQETGDPLKDEEHTSPLPHAMSSSGTPDHYGYHTEYHQDSHQQQNPTGAGRYDGPESGTAVVSGMDHSCEQKNSGKPRRGFVWTVSGMGAVLALAVIILFAVPHFHKANRPEGSSAPVPTATPATASPAPTKTPTPSPAPTKTPTPSPAPTNTPTPSPAPTNTPTPSPAPTNTPTPVPEPTGAPEQVHQEQMVSAWRDAVEKIWEPGVVSKDGKIDYAEDSFSSIKEKLEYCAETAGMIYTEKNIEDSVFYSRCTTPDPDWRDEGCYFDIQIDEQNDESPYTRGLVCYCWVLEDKDHTEAILPDAFIRMDGCNHLPSLEEFCEAYGITEEMREWLEEQPDGTYIGEEFMSPLIFCEETGVYYYISIYNAEIISAAESKSDAAKWPAWDYSVRFSKSANGEYLLENVVWSCGKEGAQT